MVIGKLKGRLLIVDDSSDTRELLERNLTSHGYSVLTASNVNEALRILNSVSIDLVITDLKMPGASGLDLVRHVKENMKDIEVMMITGYPSVEGAVAAVKSGAEEYLSKPFTTEELNTAVNRVMEKLELRRAGNDKIEMPASKLLNIIGNSESMQRVYKAISKASASIAPVHIVGERGTGKELIAKAIHFTGSRATALFVSNNCSGIPEDYFDEHLFAPDMAASSGKPETQKGFLQKLEGGTLYLKEISELPSRIQKKLAQILEKQEQHQPDSSGTHVLNYAIITDSCKDVQMMVKKGTFYKDLFFRLNENTIFIPPLKERGSDIMLFAQFFLAKFSKEIDRPVPRFTDHAIEAINNYSWPGNVAELQSFIQQLIYQTKTDSIDISDFPAHMRYNASYVIDPNRSLAEMEIEHIRNVIASVQGNKSRASEILGINRKTLREKLRLAEKLKSDT